MGARDASRFREMYTRRTRDERLCIRSASAARRAHRHHPDARASHFDPRGCAFARAHTVRFHGRPRNDVLDRASQFGTGRAPTCHPWRCTPRRRQLTRSYDGRLYLGSRRWEAPQGFSFGSVSWEIREGRGTGDGMGTSWNACQGC
jgi:hypothetical protein